MVTIDSQRVMHLRRQGVFSLFAMALTLLLAVPCCAQDSLQAADSAKGEIVLSFYLIHDADTINIDDFAKHDTLNAWKWQQTLDLSKYSLLVKGTGVFMVDSIFIGEKALAIETGPWSTSWVSPHLSKYEVTPSQILLVNIYYHVRDGQILYGWRAQRVIEPYWKNEFWVKFSWRPLVDSDTPWDVKVALVVCWLILFSLLPLHYLLLLIPSLRIRKEVRDWGPMPFIFLIVVCLYVFLYVFLLEPLKKRKKEKSNAGKREETKPVVTEKASQSAQREFENATKNIVETFQRQKETIKRQNQTIEDLNMKISSQQQTIDAQKSSLKRVREELDKAREREEERTKELDENAFIIKKMHDEIGCLKNVIEKLEAELVNEKGWSKELQNKLQEKIDKLQKAADEREHYIHELSEEKQQLERMMHKEDWTQKPADNSQRTGTVAVDGNEFYARCDEVKTKLDNLYAMLRDGKSDIATAAESVREMENEIDNILNDSF